MKILHFIYGLSLGGAESFIRSCMQSFVKDDVEWHFALQNPEITNIFFAENVISDRIHYLPPFNRNPIGQYRALSRLLKAEHFDVVHIHANALINTVPLICCIRRRQKFVIHSHSISTNHGLLCRMIHGINKTWLRCSKAAVRVACSTQAGEWMFGDSPFIVINNAIDINKYVFNKLSRCKIRDRFAIPEDAFVIGTVGRMVEAKNYPYIITLFRQYLRQNPSARALLVGDGPLRNIIEQQAADLGKRVIFAGPQQDTAPFYSAMDCFIAPSFFEGLSIVTVEAQASGANIVVSDAIPNEVNISGLVNKLSLSDPVEKWVELLASPEADPTTRVARGEKLRNSVFDLPYLAETLRSLYSKK